MTRSELVLVLISVRYLLIELIAATQVYSPDCSLPKELIVVVVVNAEPDTD